MISRAELKAMAFATDDITPAAVREAVRRTCKGLDDRTPDQRRFHMAPPEFAVFARKIAKSQREASDYAALPAPERPIPGLSPVEIKMANWTNEERTTHERIKARTRELMADGVSAWQASQRATAEITKQENAG